MAEEGNSIRDAVKDSVRACLDPNDPSGIQKFDKEDLIGQIADTVFNTLEITEREQDSTLEHWLFNRCVE